MHGLTAFVFPGQGSQTVGMGADLFAEFPLARRVYEESDAVLGWPLSEMSFSGPAEVLNDTRRTQPAVFVHSVAAFTVLKDIGLAPDMVAGHSLGEYAALFAAGALDLSTSLKLVDARASAMAAAAAKTPGTMAAVVGLDPQTVENALSGIQGVVAANFNGPDQVVISGTAEGVEEAGRVLFGLGAKRVLPLKVSGAFHSPLMADAATKVSAALSRETISEPGIPVIPNVTAAPTRDPALLRRLLVEQITGPVRWAQTVRALESAGCVRCYEVGPGKVLQGLVKRVAPAISVAGAGTALEIRALSL